MPFFNEDELQIASSWIFHLVVTVWSTQLWMRDSNPLITVVTCFFPVNLFNSCVEYVCVCFLICSFSTICYFMNVGVQGDFYLVCVWIQVNDILVLLVMIGIWAYGNVYTTYCVNRCSVNSSSVNYRSLLFVNENVYMSFCWYYISVLTTAVFYKWAALFYTLLTSITFAFLCCTVCKIIHIVAIIGSAITVWIQCLKHLFHITQKIKSKNLDYPISHFLYYCFCHPTVN